MIELEIYLSDRLKENMNIAKLSAGGALVFLSMHLIVVTTPIYSWLPRYI